MFDFSFQNLLHSNLFNFLIMFAVLWVILVKLNIQDKIEGFRYSIEKRVVESDKYKEKSLKDLEAAQESVKNLGAEINKIKTDSSKSAKVISENILKQAEDQVKKLENNNLKNISSEKNKISHELEKELSSVSLKIAKKHIKEVLRNNDELHKKIINQSIDKLDGIEF